MPAALPKKPAAGIEPETFRRVDFGFILHVRWLLNGSRCSPPQVLVEERVLCGMKTEIAGLKVELESQLRSRGINV